MKKKHHKQKYFEIICIDIHFENTNFESEIYLGIRPEDISLENKSEIAVEIKIDLIENLGSEKIIYTHINGTEIRIKSAKNIKVKMLQFTCQKISYIYLIIIKID